jgi:malonyl-CoA O-methyltransferase
VSPKDIPTRASGGLERVKQEGAIDKERARRSFARAAASYDAAAVLQREVGARMQERLDYIRLEPERVLDAGCGTGVDVEALLRRFRKARVLALDFALPMLQRARRRGGWRRRPICLCGDLEHLPLAAGSLDLVYSNLALQWANDLKQAFAEARRVLRPGGLFLFSSFGPDTLKELRSAWAEADGVLGDGALADGAQLHGKGHVSPFPDMHDVGDLLLAARFADPVMDAELLTLTYARVDDLMRDLKAIGARNASRTRPRSMTGKGRLAAMCAAYERARRDGRLPASYELVYGHAWVPAAVEPSAGPPAGGGGEVRVSLDQIRRR